MANWFIDSGLGTGLNNGTSFDDAYQNLKTALELTSYANGDYIWIRRRSSYVSATTRINITESSTVTDNMISFIGWPRNSQAITSSNWTFNSTLVRINDSGMSRSSHQARWITAPDGVDYLITRVISGDSIVIDRPYISSTATAQTATIKADEDYALAQTIGDTTWTIKKTDWNGDTKDLYKIDFSGGAAYLNFTNTSFLSFKNFEIKAGDTTFGAIGNQSSNNTLLEGFLIKQTYNRVCFISNYSNRIKLRRFTIEGTVAGSSQRGIYLGGDFAFLQDFAIYNVYDGIYFGGQKNIVINGNIGVEIASTSYDIYTGAPTHAVDLKVGNTTAWNQGSYSSYGMNTLFIENFGKVLGANRTYSDYYYLEKLLVVPSSGDPQKRTNGSDYVIKCKQNNTWGAGNKEFFEMAFDHVYKVDTSKKNYKYYIQWVGAASLTYEYIRLEAEYVSKYTDNSKYKLTRTLSANTVIQRSSASDWSNYIEVTNIQPVIPSILHIRCYFRFNDSVNSLYIDPKVEIS